MIVCSDFESLKKEQHISQLFALFYLQTRVKALFSYDPKDDTLIPCPNAGLSFSRGDILHIVSQEDPLWWQARPEKEAEGMTGIIPSQLLQER